VTSFDSALFESLVPKHCLPTTRLLDTAGVSDLRRTVRTSPDESWLDDNLLSGDLVEFLLELNRSLDQPLTLFLDRADDVPAAAVAPLVGLLDQSTPYIVVIAGRPAVAHAIPSLHDSGAVPTDHYDVIHLGVEPYSEAWQSFSSEAVARYLAANDVQLPDAATLRWCHLLGRDSLRRSARLVQVALATGDSLDLRVHQVAQLQATLVAKVRGEMRTLHPDFPAYLRSVRDQAGTSLSRGEQVSLEVEIEGTRSAFDLLGERDQFSLAILRAIRSEAICLPQGVRWHPYELPNRFEVNPLIAWDGRNTAWIQS
jgi:hypothetical protein